MSLPTSSFFTSESVCAGHPDKICDQISDAIVDAALAVDPYSRVAVETLATHEQLVLAGEITTNAKLNFAEIARTQIKRLGYTDSRFHFSVDSPINIYIHLQSPEIAVGVDNEGAGDQGMMFGYACRDTDVLMPLPIMIAHDLAAAIDSARTSTLPYLRPDGKTQVTVRYENGHPVAIERIILATPHDEKVPLKQVKFDLYKFVVLPILKKYQFKIAAKKVTVNGTGVWHIGGPSSDTGLTGRKIIVDGYGGYSRVGGGCFSGKDPTKVDRSGAYAARYIAKNLVANNLADRAEIGLAYCIGHVQPVMKSIETFSTAKISDLKIREYVNKLLDTSVSGIIHGLQLRQPIYLPTATYGHFGRDKFPWEKIDIL